FQLAPNPPPAPPPPAAERLAAKYGMSVEDAKASHDRLTALAAEEGLEYHLDRTRGGNSFDGHRVVQLGKAAGRGDAMQERLMRAYFTDNVSIDDQEPLVRLAGEAGLDADEARAVLTSDDYA